MSMSDNIYTVREKAERKNEKMYNDSLEYFGSSIGDE